MTETELVKMAAFKLHDTANRLFALGSTSANRQVHEHLQRLAKMLLNEERQLLDHIGGSTGRSPQQQRYHDPSDDDPPNCASG